VTPSRTYWCELAWLGGEIPEASVVIETEGDRIASVSTRVSPPPPDAHRLEGLTIPGLANAHSHAFQRALRGRTHAGRGDFWRWRDAMYALAERINPELYFSLARATFAEMALAGVTCVGEFHYLHHGPGGVPYDDPNEIGRALIEAAREAGIRITLLDACYLHGGIGEAPNEVQRRFSDGDAGRWASRVGELAEAPGVRIGAAIHSVRAVDPDSARVVAGWSGGRPVHAHVSEQPDENEACIAAYGRTPAALLADAGALGPQFTAVHATHLTDDDVPLLGGSRSTCCLCPTTERDLADGIGPAGRLAAAGAPLAVGSDSHAVIDLIEEARAIELDERLATGRRGTHGVRSLLRAATAAGHASLGWPDAGRIEAGATADLVTLGLDSARLAGTGAEHALASLLFAGSAADVRNVVVGGRAVVRGGAHVELDVTAELTGAIQAVWR
jgi:formiminoglutamate deiminase